MGMYRTVQLSFWTDRMIEDDFTPQDKYFYLFLLTNPYTNICGCYELSIKQMSHYTGFNEDVIQNLLLQHQNLYRVCKFCSETSEILILNWHKYNWSKSEKTLKGAYLKAKQIKNREFRDYVMQLLMAYGCEIEDEYTKFAYPMEASVTVTVTNNTINLNKSDNKGEIVKRGKAKSYSEEFETFWECYPRKVGKGEAYKSFNKALDRGAVLDDLLDGVAMYKRTFQWKKQNGAYIPNPATWLNQNRWQDSPEEDTGIPQGRNSRSDEWAKLFAIANGEGEGLFANE